MNPDQAAAARVLAKGRASAAARDIMEIRFEYEALALEMAIEFIKLDMLFDPREFLGACQLGLTRRQIKARANRAWVDAFGGDFDRAAQAMIASAYLRENRPPPTPELPPVCLEDA